MQKRIFSGMKPTGPLHLGNYLGALRNWVELQREYESFFCVVNLHAITVTQNPAELAARTSEIARLFLAVGVDPKISTIFVQSDVPEHAELTWILNCIARMGELGRMTQFKEKSAWERLLRGQLLEAKLKDSGIIYESTSDRLFGERTSVGLFDYPVLMAADILLYKTDLVPVGEDQKQHLELTRDLAVRFNRDYGETFRLPEPFIPKVGARIMSLSDPTKKMAKSDENPNGCIELLDDAATIERKFKRAVTDSGTEIRFDATRPAITNLLTIYQLLTGKQPDEIETYFAGKGYAALKSELAGATTRFLQPLQQRAREIGDDELQRLLADGAERARQIARATLDEVKERIGIVGAAQRSANERRKTYER